MNSTRQPLSATAASNAASGGSQSQRSSAARPLASFAVSTFLFGAFLLPLPARAADGCLVLLCLAAPSWQNIAQCIDPVRQVLRDLAHGHPFPSCAMSGRGNSAANQWASAPAFCPPQYTTSYVDGGTFYVCAYAGAVEVNVDGALWSRVWWNPSGDNVTEFTPAARARLGSWNTRFDDDYATWLALQPPTLPSAGF